MAALAGGDIDMIVSDHSPCTADLKRRDTGDFAAAWGGIASLELGLPVVWTAARTRGHGLADVVRWMARAPADRVGLTYKGRIEVGADADLVVFDPEAEFVVDPSHLRQRNPVSAYAGRRLTGTVRQTWLRGERVDPTSAARHGRLMRRGREMTSYYVPRGGLPPQTELATDRARFTEAYAVLCKRHDDATSSPVYLPFWEDTRLWVIARPLSRVRGDVLAVHRRGAPGGGSDRPESDPDAEAGAVRRRRDGAAHDRGASRTPWNRAATPTSRRAARGRCTTAGTGPPPFTGSARPTSASTGLDAPAAGGRPTSARSSLWRCPTPTAHGQRRGSSTRPICATTCTSTS